MATVYKEHLKLPLNGQVESPVSILSCSFLFKEGLADVLAKAGTSTRSKETLLHRMKCLRAGSKCSTKGVPNLGEGLSTDAVRSGGDSNSTVREEEDHNGVLLAEKSSYLYLFTVWLKQTKPPILPT